MNFGIILASGKGQRFSKSTQKQFYKINNKKILYYSIDKFLQLKNIDIILLILNKQIINSDNFKDILKIYKKELQQEKVYIVFGGKERYDSVYNALSFINDFFTIKKNDNVIIHDAARPNVNINDIKKLIYYLNKYDAVSLSYKLNDSIKEKKIINDGICEVIKSYDRDKFSMISTPQGFNFNLILNCYNKFINNKKEHKITDDLQIVELFSKTKSYLIDSDSRNIKITTKNDLQMLKNVL